MQRIVIDIGVRYKKPYTLECNLCHCHFPYAVSYFNYGGGGFFCSRKCSANFYLHKNPPWNKGKIGYNSGEKNPTWKGGKYKDRFGYIHIRKLDHPNRAQNGYVLEHRVVMELHLGRYLNKDEIVHHLNEQKDDNRIENLVVMTQSKHVGEHFRLNGKWSKKYNECKVCKTTSKKHSCLGMCKPCYRNYYYITKKR